MKKYTVLMASLGMPIFVLAQEAEIYPDPDLEPIEMPTEARAAAKPTYPSLRNAQQYGLLKVSEPLSQEKVNEWNAAQRKREREENQEDLRKRNEESKKKLAEIEAQIDKELAITRAKIEAQDKEMQRIVNEDFVKKDKRKAKKAKPQPELNQTV